jgi:hypothetical protein
MGVALVKTKMVMVRTQNRDGKRNATYSASLPTSHGWMELTINQYLFLIYSAWCSLLANNYFT